LIRPYKKGNIIMASVAPHQTVSKVGNLTATVLVVWFLLALSGSLLGVFDGQPRPPIPLGLAAVIPFAFFATCYFVSAEFRHFILSLDARLLTLAQTWRVAGIVFLILYLRRELPGTFALPAGLGDMAIGISAPVIGWLWKRPFPQRLFVAWNVLGIFDLVLAVSLGVLSSATPIGLLAGDVTTQLMGTFPLSLIPTFFVPLFVIFHLISLIQVSKQVPFRS
jgi:hypothetical protein